ncbi:MAG: prepilin peptidase [Desulfocucumaceae bacterium]
MICLGLLSAGLITYPTIVVGVAINIIAGKYENLFGGLIVFVMYLFFFLSGKMGAGDLKLAVALSFLLGLQPVLFGSLAAGVILLVWGFASTWYRSGQLHTAVMVAAGRLPGNDLPYGAILGPASVLCVIIFTV